MKYEFSAGFIVTHEGKFLLLFAGDRVDTPKGNIERGETSLQAALRELREETGIENIEIVKNFKADETFFYRLQGQLIKKKITYFLGVAKTDKIKLSKEHDSYRWVSFEEAMQIVKYKGLKSVLIKAKEVLNSK